MLTTHITQISGTVRTRVEQGPSECKRVNHRLSIVIHAGLLLPWITFFLQQSNQTPGRLNVVTFRFDAAPGGEARFPVALSFCLCG